MTQTLKSTRFGDVELADDAVVEFPNGLIGLRGTRYALVPHGDDGTFVWLHSMEDPDLALPITRPWNFFTDYEIELSDSEAERIGVTDPSESDVYVTVRATGAAEDFTANLRAPIVITGGRGFQVINDAGDPPVRAPLFGHPVG
ncbi:MAG TPA: flagellar assembly protein FliW [Solirubrobacteraceae bacterium]|jgi:flagellar assembly factor FliW|nr:flagellar assembly protein FliW [Solirubrobacteraceae bacterium]